MSVYKRPNASTYSYDFRLGGRRFSGDTGKTREREARQEEERIRRDQQARLDRLKGDFGADMSVGMAFTRFMIEVGQFHKHADTTLTCLEWLQSHLGKERSLISVGENDVAALVSRRRQEMRQVGKLENRNKTVSNATVNRTCTQLLRKVMLRAEAKWDVPVRQIDWASHKLLEPKERVREARRDEEASLMDQLARGYDVAVEFAILTGCRRMEIVGLVWHRVDFFNRQFSVVGKGGKLRSIPMSKAVFELLWGEKDFDPLYVFTYEARRTDKRKGIHRGVRYPMTDAGLRTAHRRAVSNAGIENLRFHDLRHTAATRILRHSNLRVVQNLLGHSDPATTAKYAHAVAEDIRDAMDATNPTRLPTDEIEYRLNTLIKKKKSV